MQTRDAVVTQRVKKDFPKQGSWTIAQTSTKHAKCPEKSLESARIEIRINGIILEDAPEIKGTKLTWVLH